MANSRILSIAFTVAFAAAVSMPAAAVPPPGKGNSHDAAAALDVDAQTLIDPDIDYEALRSIAVSQHYTGYRALPPGIAKNLARGKPLPPGIAKKHVPAALVAQLPTYPDYEWRRCGTDLVLVQIATQVVAEVVANIFK